MKKYILFSFLFISYVSFGQEHVNFGVKVGQNFTKIDNVVADRTKASFHMGAIANIRLTNLLSLAPEVILSQTKLEADPSRGSKCCYGISSSGEAGVSFCESSDPEEP